MTNERSSYFQELFPTTHYTIVLGGNGSGKSSYGDVFTETGYRVVNLTNPNAANINRILCCIEVGSGKDFTILSKTKDGEEGNHSRACFISRSIKSSPTVKEALRASRENQWLVIKGNDEFKSKDDLTITRPESVLTGRTNQDLENANTTH